MAGRPPIDGYLGDPDMDGVVTLEDAQLVTDASVGKVILTEEQIRRGDVTFMGVDARGRLDIVNALRIAQYVNGVIDTFPKPGEVVVLKKPGPSMQAILGWVALGGFVLWALTRGWGKKRRQGWLGRMK